MEFFKSPLSNRSSRIQYGSLHQEEEETQYQDLSKSYTNSAKRKTSSTEFGSNLNRTRCKGVNYMRIMDKDSRKDEMSGGEEESAGESDSNNNNHDNIKVVNMDKQKWKRRTNYNNSSNYNSNNNSKDYLGDTNKHHLMSTENDNVLAQSNANANHTNNNNNRNKTTTNNSGSSSKSSKRLHFINTILRTWFWSLLLLNYQIDVVAADGCPLVCICKWKSGKQTVECRNQNLNTLPTDIDIETQVLDISGNKLQVLPRDAFRRAGLLNLQRIYIHGSELRQIDSGAFNELINLVELDLSDNYLTAVPSSAFRATPFLRELNLAGNPLVHIQNGAFEFIKHLVKLDLSRAQLVRIDKNAFSHMQLLELKISSNNLTTINNNTVKSLSQLHGIELHNNPWNCDCRLHDLKTWLETKNIPTTIPPLCKSPERLAQRKFTDLSASEFACTPKILNDPAETTIQVHEEDNATIVCLYDAIPVTKILWYSYHKLITNNTMISATRKFLIFEDRIDRSILILTNVLEKDSGEFHCRVENPAGFAEANFTLQVLARPPFPFPTLPTIHIIYIALALLGLLLLLSVGVLITFWRKRRARRHHKPPEILATSTPVKPPRLSNYDVSNISPTSQHHHNIGHNNLPNGFNKNKIESATDNPDLILETNNSGSYQENGLEEQSSNSELNWEQQSYRNLGYSTEYPPDYGLPIIHENSVYGDHVTPNNYYNTSSNANNLMMNHHPHQHQHHHHHPHSKNNTGGNSGLIGNGGLHHMSSSGSGSSNNVGGGAMMLDPGGSNSMNNSASGGNIVSSGSNNAIGVGSGSASVLMSGVWSKNKVGTRIVRAPSARDSPDEGYQEGYCGTDV